MASPGLFDKYEDALAAAVDRITPRDRWLLSLLLEHQVLTTEQITAIAFPSEDASRHRLVILYRLGVLDRFRPISTNGRASFHYVIGSIGGLLLAAERNIDPAHLAYDRNRIRAMVESPMLRHRVGVNGFFADLSLVSRSRDCVRLHDWWSERQCIREWGRDVQPDGYGVIESGNVRLPFFLEYDRGTESLTRVVAKLGQYRAFDFGTVLFWFLTPAREANFRRMVPATSRPFATANASLGRPSDFVWSWGVMSAEREGIEDTLRR